MVTCQQGKSLRKILALKNANEQRYSSTLTYSILCYGKTGLRKQNCCWGEREKQIVGYRKALKNVDKTRTFQVVFDIHRTVNRDIFL